MVAWTIRSIFLAFPQLYCEVFSEVFVVVNDDLAHFPLPPQTDKLISPGLSEQVPTCLFLFPSLLFLHFAGIVVPRTLRAQRGDSGLAKFWLEYWEFGNYCTRNMNETKATSPCSFRLRMCGLTRPSKSKVNLSYGALTRKRDWSLYDAQIWQSQISHPGACLW